MFHVASFGSALCCHGGFLEKRFFGFEDFAQFTPSASH
jgi:hypothetical protein